MTNVYEFREDRVKYPLGDTSDILSILEIYASKMRPFFTFWEGSLSGQYDLISIERLYDLLGMIEIELGEYVIEEEYDRERKVSADEEYFELLECEEEDFILSTREEEMTRFPVDRESEIIEMWPDMCMS